MTFSIVTDGFGTFVRNAIKDVFKFNPFKEIIRLVDRRNGSKSSA